MIHLGRSFGALALLVIAMAGNSRAQPILPVAASPEEVGLSSASSSGSRP